MTEITNEQEKTLEQKCFEFGEMVSKLYSSFASESYKTGTVPIELIKLGFSMAHYFVAGSLMAYRDDSKDAALADCQDMINSAWNASRQELTVKDDTIQ
jgi:hypothetical protein